jgi:hypothetical protein
MSVVVFIIVWQVGCVDGRQDNNKSDIGALISERQLMNLMTDNNTEAISIVFHTDCGYLVTAIAIHMLFKTMKECLDPKDAVTMVPTYFMHLCSTHYSLFSHVFFYLSTLSWRSHGLSVTMHWLKNWSNIWICQKCPQHRYRAFTHSYLQLIDTNGHTQSEQKKVEDMLLNLITDNHGTLRYATR